MLPLNQKLLFIHLWLILVFNGCAHTEKYLHPEPTFSPNTYNPNLDGVDGPQLSDSGAGGHSLPIYEVCADYASIHSPVIWVPIIGPMIDSSLSAKEIGTPGSRFDNALIYLPLIGPAASFSGMSPKTCTYKTLRQSHLNSIDTGIQITGNELNYITQLADENCNKFLDRLSSSKDGLEFGKTALSDIAGGAAAGTAYYTPLGTSIITAAKLLTDKGAENLANTYFGGQLIPAIKNKIHFLRESYKSKYIHSSEHLTLPELLSIIKGYDKTCSVQYAIDSLNNPDSKAETNNNPISDKPGQVKDSTFATLSDYIKKPDEEKQKLLIPFFTTPVIYTNSISLLPDKENLAQPLSPTDVLNKLAGLKTTKTGCFRLSNRSNRIGKSFAFVVNNEENIKILEAYGGNDIQDGINAIYLRDVTDDNEKTICSTELN